MAHIVTLKSPSREDWLVQLADVITDPDELLHFLNVESNESLLAGRDARRLFALRVPRAFAARMEKGNPNDPLLLQVMTHRSEFIAAPGFSEDPLDEQHSVVPGLLHKYRNRALLLVKGGCAVNCRYCFRRHFPYQENLPKNEDWIQIKQYLLDHPDINEVILSGGDPLTLTNKKLALWIERLEGLPQLKMLRIHSRVPIVIPDRIDEEFISLLKNSRLHIILVIHSNHASEIDEYTAKQLQRLTENRVTVLNQAVLLKGVNDSVEQLAALSYRLLDARVMPYYLHVLDKVKGAHHFDLPTTSIDQIYTELLARLPGYLVPKLVREIAGEKNKTPLYGTPIF